MALRFRLTPVLLLAAAGALARGPSASPVGLDVGPSLVEITVTAGDSAERSVTLTNPGASPVEVTASVFDWRMSEDGEVRFEKAGTSPTSCAAWIRVDPERILVPAGGQTVLRVRIATPGSFSGTRWAAVLFALPAAETSWEGETALVAPRVGLTVYVTAAGTEREEFRLIRASARPEPAGVRLAALVENAGNTAVRFGATWQLRSADSRSTRSFEIRSSVALPGSRREVTLDSKESLAPGAYTVTAMVRWGKKRWAAADAPLTIPPRSPL
jgi:P pilus assembly chaperone PapD